MQQTPQSGSLVLVATPLGNLGDLSPRGLSILATADAVYCEDTRHSRTLFSANGIALEGRLHALHEHNEVAQSAEVVARVLSGETVALITDAGTPGISDPGTRVVAAVAEAGGLVTTAPGPSAVIGALSISGLPTEQFVMDGFVPRKRGERDKWYDAWALEQRTIVFYESPQRIVTTLGELAERFGERRIAVVRELTKLHEEVVRGTVVEVADVFTQRKEVLGEICVVLHGATPDHAVSESDIVAALQRLWSEGESTSDSVDHVASALGVAKRTVYQLALDTKRVQ